MANIARDDIARLTQHVVFYQELLRHAVGPNDRQRAIAQGGVVKRVAIKQAHDSRRDAAQVLLLEGLSV